jgi:hypothetical protein
MCAFKLIVADTVKFYELAVIREHQESLLLQLKHFHGDLRGWESKDETVDFPLVRVGEDRVWFDGFTFVREDKDHMTIYVRISNQGSVQEMPFRYHRVTTAE